MPVITSHAKRRLAERTGVKGSNAQKRLVGQAFSTGIPHFLANGELLAFLNKLYLTHKKANNLRLYKKHVYIFRGGVLMTVLKVPEHLWPELEVAQQSKTLNAMAKQVNEMTQDKVTHGDDESRGEDD